MIRNALMFIFLNVFSSYLFGGEVNLKFAEANKQYRNGKYTEALLLYREILNNGFVAHELYYNLANTYIKLDSIPLAILYYEKANKIAPGDEDVNYNLKLANLKIIDKIESLPKMFYNEWLDNTGRLFSSDRWAFLTLLLIWLTIILLAQQMFLLIIN